MASWKEGKGDEVHRPSWFNDAGESPVSALVTLAGSLVSSSSLPSAPRHPDPRASLSEMCLEDVNPLTTKIDKLGTLEMCRAINAQDAMIASAVEVVTPVIANVIDRIVERLLEGGRLLYMGAGTSGSPAESVSWTWQTFQLRTTETRCSTSLFRLAAMAHFGHPARQLKIHVLLVLPTLAPCYLAERTSDALVGISASGGTPYVLGALQSARAYGLLTVGLVCSPFTLLHHEGHCDYVINPVVGPEVIAGSTRMKAGTATKMVLNMISTGIQIKLGNTYGNLMVNVQPHNIKTMARARVIVRTIAGSRVDAFSDADLDNVLARCGGSVKLTAVAVASGWDLPYCMEVLKNHHGSLAELLQDLRFKSQLMSVLH
ncbi:unnamed protein product [Mycena citricolor]|uniref:SIS domain-containing protein n=1 Tax=Mycena citricolor TaxID=2018698 RepID=A0AAD2Q0D1_9AGAR|nr:unnamed protein product [Mycena citricolor]